MNSKFLRHFAVLLQQSLRFEITTSGSLWAPALFSLTVQLLLFFVAGDLLSVNPGAFAIAQAYLAAFLGLQLAFIRIFAPDQEDGVIILLRATHVQSEAWFLAKFLTVFISATFITWLSLGCASLLSPNLVTKIMSLSMLGVSALAVAGLAAVGTLTAALTSQTEQRSVIFPLIYFPLTAPVLLAATQASLSLINGKSDTLGLLNSWLGLLLVFDVIYITLSTVLFGELLKPETN